jgi:hypothetical protein
MAEDAIDIEACCSYLLCDVASVSAVVVAVAMRPNADNASRSSLQIKHSRQKFKQSQRSICSTSHTQICNAAMSSIAFCLQPFQQARTSF